MVVLVTFTALKFKRNQPEIHGTKTTKQRDRNTHSDSIKPDKSGKQFNRKERLESEASPCALPGTDTVILTSPLAPSEPSEMCRPLANYVLRQFPYPDSKMMLMS